MQEGIKNNFVSSENRNFKYRLGNSLASSLSGFLAGIIVTLIIMRALFDITLK